MKKIIIVCMVNIWSLLMGLVAESYDLQLGLGQYYDMVVINFTTIFTYLTIFLSVLLTIMVVVKSREVGND